MKKMGGDEVSARFREKLQQNFDELQLTTDRMFNFYKDSMNIYSSSMQQMLSTVYPYASQTDFIRTHQKSKKEAISQVWDDELEKVFEIIWSNTGEI